MNNKNESARTKILDYLLQNGNATVSDLVSTLNVSSPTVSKFLNELRGMGYVDEYGKIETSEGRRPTVFGARPDSAYFLGVDTEPHSASIGLIDFRGNMVAEQMDMPFQLENNDNVADDMASIITDFVDKAPIDKKLIKCGNVNVSGRVNPKTGCCYSPVYISSDMPLAKVVSEKTHLPMFIDNDSRAMTYGEYVMGDFSDVRNMIFVNISWGLGMGMIINGELYTGRSGFAGELGHIHSFNNEIICRCGKKGCLETECSGIALHREVVGRLRNGEGSILQPQFAKTGHVTLDDIIQAILKEDVLCADALEKMGCLLGEQLAGVINIFNPDALIIGGLLSQTGEPLLHHINTGIMKYSLNFVKQDTRVSLSKLKKKAGIVGACMLARKASLENGLLVSK